MANIIKVINVGGTDYEVYDAYARRRLEGAGTVYSISHAAAYSSSNTYFDVTTQAVVTLSAELVGNSAFNSTGESISVAKTKYLITLNQTATANQYYVIKIDNLVIGDSVFVLETGVPDRWFSSKDSTNGSFRKLEEKIDLSEYAKKGTYDTTTNGATETGSAGAHSASGSATVTYKKSATVTGSAGAISQNTGSSHGEADADTGTAGSATVDFSKATFKGTSVTLSGAGSVTGLSIDAHAAQDLTISGSQEIAAHSHTVNVGTSSATVVTGIPNFNGGSASGTFNTDAIKDVTLSASTITTDGPKYIEDVSHTAQSLTGTTVFNTDAIKSAALTGTTTFNTDAIKSVGGTKNWGFAASIPNTTTTPGVMYAPKVTNGVLSWSTAAAATQDAHTGTAASTASVGITVTAASTASVGISAGSFSKTTKYMKRALTNATTATVSWTPASLGTLTTSKLTYVTGATTSKNTTVTIQGSNFSAALPSLTHSVTGSASVSLSIGYTPEGTISGTQTIAAHSHSYKKPADHVHSISVSAHTHSIALTDATVTGSAVVAVTSHTHSIAQHSHKVTI